MKVLQVADFHYRRFISTADISIALKYLIKICADHFNLTVTARKLTVDSLIAPLYQLSHRMTSSVLSIPSGAWGGGGSILLCSDCVESQLFFDIFKIFSFRVGGNRIWKSGRLFIERDL